MKSNSPYKTEHQTKWSESSQLQPVNKQQHLFLICLLSHREIGMGKEKVETSSNYSADPTFEACILSSLLYYGQGVCIPQT